MLRKQNPVAAGMQADMLLPRVESDASELFALQLIDSSEDKLQRPARSLT